MYCITNKNVAVESQQPEKRLELSNVIALKIKDSAPAEQESSAQGGCANGVCTLSWKPNREARAA